LRRLAVCAHNDLPPDPSPEFYDCKANLLHLKVLDNTDRERFGLIGKLVEAYVAAQGS